MAFVRVAFSAGASQGHVEALAEQLGDVPDPPGRLLFAAGPVSGGWQVVQVWTSRDDLAAFDEAHLRPALEALGYRGFPVAPVVTDLEPALVSGPVVDRLG